MLSPESYLLYVLFSIPLPNPNQCIVIPNVPVLEWTQSSAITSSTLSSIFSELTISFSCGRIYYLKANSWFILKVSFYKCLLF